MESDEDELLNVGVGTSELDFSDDRDDQGGDTSIVMTREQEPTERVWN